MVWTGWGGGDVDGSENKRRAEENKNRNEQGQTEADRGVISSSVLTKP